MFVILWKTVHIDPYKQKLPPGDPIKKENYNDFMMVKDSLSRPVGAIKFYL